MTSEPQKASYKSAGVDLETYEQSMAQLPDLMKSTFRPGVIENMGGFAGLFQLNESGRKFDDPVLVSGTDGVGTKLKVATLANKHDTIGIDLVAMCVNDVICCGAEPLFFLDYVAMSKDDPDLLKAIVEGVSVGCRQAGAALLGGETAIMPDLYGEGEYDVAGFCVGVVERSEILDGSGVKPGDHLLGITSSGLHSNGYSLVRKIVFEMAGLSLSDEVDDLHGTVGDALLKPTKIYAQLTKALRAEPELNSKLNAIAHITGGGLVENVSRVLPESLTPKIKPNSWMVPPIFSWLQNLGNVDEAEMNRVFNMGIGLVLVVDQSAAVDFIRAVERNHFDCFELGVVVDNN